MKQKLMYWIPTGLVAAMMTMGGIMDLLNNPQVAEGVKHLGYPTYFPAMLGVAKLLGVAALVLPVPSTVRDWAYAGFTFELIAAVVSHAAVGDPMANIVTPAVVLGVLLLSYRGWRTQEPRRVLAPVMAGPEVGKSRSAAA